MIEKHNLRLTVAVRVVSDSPENAKKALEFAFKSMLENKAYRDRLQNLQIEFEAYSIAEVKKI